MNRFVLSAALTGLLASLSAVAQVAPGQMTGSAAAPESAQRTVIVAPDAKWVNVTQGEVVRFVVGNAVFGWRFDERGSRSFDLQQIAPAGTLSRPVTVYITSSPGHRP